MPHPQPSRISIIIPVFNEKPTINELLARVWDQPLPKLKKELVIVESNSTDGTREEVVRWCESRRKEGDLADVKLILQPGPRGKGHAVREGLAQCTGDIVLIQDGDLEYDMKDYPSLLEPIVDGRARFVLGSRHLSAGGWKIRKFETNPVKALLLNLGGVFFHGFFNLVYGTRLTDPTTMYKVFRRECVQDLHFTANRFDFDFELLGKLIRAGYKPLEIPISYASRGFEAGKKINVLRDPWTWVVAILKYRFSRLRSTENERLQAAAAGAALQGQVANPHSPGTSVK